MASGGQSSSASAGHVSGQQRDGCTGSAPAVTNFEEEYCRFCTSTSAATITRSRRSRSAPPDQPNTYHGFTLADHAFVYNFGNPFSGTHFGYPRMYGARLKFTFH